MMSSVSMLLIRLVLAVISLQLCSLGSEAFVPSQRKNSIASSSLKPPSFLSFPLRVSSNITEPPPKEDTTHDEKDNSIRPLTQNWWPVTLTSALDRSKPNPVELLDQKLVLWKPATNGSTWSCLADRCAHRFAPLSEGRVKDQCLQCAYHGWEFEGGGACHKIPQSTNGNLAKRVSVKHYPVREAAGMVWVWADPETPPPSDDPLPISSLLERFHHTGATARGFMRDLPYGMEFLGENLVDISHLPFSHHSVGALNRQDGRPVPLEMLTPDQKLETAKSYNDNPNKLPLFQGKVINAADHDPELVASWKTNPRVQANADKKMASSTVAFFDPCHVRYHRNAGQEGASYEINLFMCPTSAGKSRVFLFTPFEMMLPPVGSEKKKDTDGKEESNDKKKKKERDGKQPNYKPFLLKENASKLLGRKKAPAAFPAYIGHMVAHSIFDGDGIFLHKQGDRMHRAGLSFRDYHTPTSSDIVVNAYRRWLDKVAGVTTRQEDGERVARAVLGAPDAYGEEPRADMLDRYNTHTKNCKICLDALKEMQEKRQKLSLATTALVGATGASGALFGLASILWMVTKALRSSPSSRLLIPTMFACAGAVIGSVLGAKRVVREGERLDKEIKRFYFEDYVHAEKD